MSLGTTFSPGAECIRQRSRDQHHIIITYAYRYSSSSGRIILASIRNDENDSSYWRGLNDVWFTYDSSRQQIQCGRPPEADTCPPLPVR